MKQADIDVEMTIKWRCPNCGEQLVSALNPRGKARGRVLSRTVAAMANGEQRLHEKVEGCEP